MDKLTAIKIKYDDGTYSDEIPIRALAENVEWDDTHTLMDVLGSVDVDITGTIQDQISQLFNEKINYTQLNNYVASQLNIDVTTWLENNVDPVGSAVVVDKSLNIEGAAADAKEVGNLIRYDNAYSLTPTVDRTNAIISNGVSFVYNTNTNKWLVNRISPYEQAAALIIIRGDQGFNNGMVAGGTYGLSFSSTSINITARCYAYHNNILDEEPFFETFSTDYVQFVIPSNATGVQVRVHVQSGVNPDNDQVSISVLNTKTNTIITKDIHLLNEMLFDNARLFTSELLPTFVLGTINLQTGSAGAPSTNRIYESEFIKENGLTFIRVKDDAEITFRFYSEANPNSYVGYTHFLTGFINVTNLVKTYNAHYYRIVVRYKNNADINNVQQLAKKLTIVGIPDNDAKILKLVLEPGNYGVPFPGFTESSTRCRHKYLIPVCDGLKINADSGYYFSTRWFDEKLNYIGGDNDWCSGSREISKMLQKDVFYILIAFKDSYNSTMTPNKLIDIAEHVSIYITNYKDDQKYKVTLSTSVMKQGITDNEVITPTVCAVKYKHVSGKQDVPIGWLFRDNQEPFNFYWSNDGSNMEFLFAWDKTVTDTGNREPLEYAFIITYEGDIVCVFRGEYAYVKGVRGSGLRQNPIVYKHDDYSHPVTIEFSSIKPISGVMDTGYYVEQGTIYIAEYTRFGHDYAYVWRVTEPYYNTSDWEIIKSFQVSGNQQGFKHCHNIDRDPYTGILWLTTGDVPPTDPQYVGTPGIYYSIDNGDTWTTLLEGSEKNCRQLNFIWTKDYVYWASDTPEYELHYFIRTKRDANGIIDVSSMEDVFHFFTRTATYYLCYSDNPHGILCLQHWDNATTSPINFYFWSIDDEKMYVVGRVDGVTEGYTGFRVDAINCYPAANNIGYLCGFSLNPGNLNIPGNKYVPSIVGGGYAVRDSDNIGLINNLIIKIESA